MNSSLKSVKDIAPKDIFTLLVNVFLQNHPFEEIESYISKDFMGFGSALDEKVFGVDVVKWMVFRQREELGKSKVITNRQIIYEKTFAGENAVIIVEEIAITIEDGDSLNTIPLRISILFEKTSDKWQINHFHASIADANTPEGSAWPIEVLKRKNQELEQKVAERTSQLEKSIEDLKATQTQLVHSEKMASLGELTAGIAHEIQNPLNFINNFAELNTELIDEINEEIKDGNWKEVKDLAKDLKTNEEKIVHHGKRADSIVKGMLQHSRTGDGEKQLTNVNELVDEYVRLAYHGFKAKEKSFNVKIVSNYEKNIAPIKIIPQDIGRVLLNLINNAFHAVSSKDFSINTVADDLFTKKAIETTNSYDPEIRVSTTQKDGDINITVQDNGSGIPDELINKIFQPFFTTKPTGKGTGLGLSLSYDIVKAHGGELKVESEQGIYTKFTIFLPG